MKLLTFLLTVILWPFQFLVIFIGWLFGATLNVKKHGVLRGRLHWFKFTPVLTHEVIKKQVDDIFKQVR